MSLRNILFFSLCQPLMAAPFAPNHKPVIFRQTTNHTLTNSTQPATNQTQPATNSTLPALPAVEWAKKTCKDKGVTDASLEPATRWNSLDTRNALSAANYAWNHNPVEEGHIRLSYPMMVSNFFQGPEQWNCQDIANVPCSTTIKCDETNYPAGHFILNSFSRLHQIHQQLNDALNQAQLNIQSQIGTFTSTFTTEFKDDTAFIKLLLDVLGLSIGLGSAYFWNRVAPVILKTMTPDTRDLYKDATKAAVTFGVKQGKEKIPKAKDALGSQNNLNNAMGVYFQTWRESISAYVDHIFSGKVGALGDLGRLIGSGGFNYNSGPNLSQMQKRTEAIVFAQLIATAWKTNPAKKLYPFIMETDIDCNDSGKAPKDLKNFMDDSTAAQAHVCYNGHVYYLLQAVHRDQPVCHKECIPNTSAGKFFQTLPGGTFDNLSGDKWAGVRVDDFIVSSVDAWNANGNKNGYGMPDAETYAADLTDVDQNDLDANFEKVLRAPGVYQIPVCKSSDMSDIAAQVGGSKGKPSGDWWPCNP
ncbi:hypothetical protein K469DRAFT_748124 [Zopfia rhizophila CBS 207.26]|uniref:Uncharacterized protein n=1 Tax=Zopfia rhizophila CBS 207.26 TaxID=1314779 RepID=A0A6A6ECW2_9PEZI|nr:hypothetical protein K469DRAFT_748124 [Zopfia rhizophila CBS 207.26]